MHGTEGKGEHTGLMADGSFRAWDKTRQAKVLSTIK